MSNFGDHPAGFFADPSFYNGVATQSLRFDYNSSHYLYRTPGTAGNRRKWTFSFWLKKQDDNSNNQIVISAATSEGDGTSSDGNTFSQIQFKYVTSVNWYDFLQFYNNTDGGSDYSEELTRSIRDTTNWYHIVVAVDTTQSTAGNRVKYYVNGELQTSVSQYYAQIPQNYDTYFNMAHQHWIGRSLNNNSIYFNGYLAEINFVDGTQYAASDFGEFKNGVWIAKNPSVTYGTNGYRLQFKQTGTGTASASTIGADTSGNNNHWTSGNLSAHDVMPDSPENNFCTLNPLDNDNITLTEGNLSGISTANAHNGLGTTFGVTGGKWYWEIRSAGTGSNYFFGMARTTFSMIGQYTNDAHNFADLWCVATDGPKANGGGEVSYGSALSSGDILQLAFDLDNGKFYAGKNGTYFASGDPAAGTNAAFTNVPTDEHMSPFYGNSTGPLTHIFNFGQDSSFAGTETAQGNKDGNGIGDFYYAPPTGFRALCSTNLPEPTIGPNSGTDEQSDDYFNPILYTGNGGTGHAISGVGFQPDWTWIKGRSDADSHYLVDSSRGYTERLFAPLTDAATVESNTVTQVDSDGFTLGSDTGVNRNNSTYVAWNWKANGGTKTTNDASATSVGSIDSDIQANTTAGFSIVQFETNSGTSGSAQTVAHGLSAAPTFMILKSRDQAGTGWMVYYGDNTDYVQLQSNGATIDGASTWNDTSPTSTVFSIGTNGGDTNNTNGGSMIAYVFHDVEGYSKFGSYVGNGKNDGNFIFTGFRPAFILVKSLSSSRNWAMYDSVRDVDNPTGAYVAANLSDQEFASAITYAPYDFVSNGFKLVRGNDDVSSTVSSDVNANGQTYIYMAFAEAPFKYANAR